MAAWYRKKIVIILGAVLVVILAVLLALPYLLDIDRYRPAIVEQMEKATGREVDIERLRLHFLPTTHVAVVNFRVKNPSGFPEGDTLLVESISVGVALLSLLGDTVEVTSVTLDGVELNLLSNELGRTNYDLPKPSRRGNPKGERDAGAAAPPISRIDSIALRDVTVTSGSFWSRQKKVIPGWTLTGLALDVRGLDLSQPDPLKTVETSLDLSRLELSSPSLKEPLRFSDGEIKVASGAADGDFAARLGKLNAKGTVKVANLATPVLDFTLSSDELNTEQLAAVMGGAAQAGPSGGGRGDLLARGSLQVGRVVAPPLTVRNYKAQARIYGNRIDLDPYSFEIFGGRVRGNSRVDTSQSSMPASTSVQVEGVDVKQALAELNPGGKAAITGTFEADARLSLALAARDPLSALGGAGTFAVRNGTFPGLDVGGTLVKMAKAFQMNVPAGDTRFTYFGGDFNIAAQRVHSRNLELRGEALDADLSGSFGFDETLNYSGTGLVKGSGTVQQQEEEKSPAKLFGRVLGRVVQQTMNISGARVPFTVRGTFADPKFMVTGPPTPIPIR